LPTRNQGVPETLMIPLAVIMLDEFGDGETKMRLQYQDKVKKRAGRV
jgi:hypothetical protein